MTLSALPDFFDALRRQTGGDIRTDEVSRTLYSTDASIYQVMPLGVCFPRDKNEVAAIVTTAAEYGIPILPRAGGTGLAGQTVNEALVIDFSHHMTDLLEVNVEERWARVQPGLVFATMNRRLAADGLMFGPDPASGNRAGLGGIVGNNATGSHSILYGMTADHVMGMEAILADGSVVRLGSRTAAELPAFAQKSGIEGAAYRTLLNQSKNQAETIRNGTPRHWRRCGGYNLFRFIDGVAKSPYTRRDEGLFNLAQLMTGSEGTLGVMTEFQLNLVPTPAKTALAIVHFDEAYAALDATQIILQTDPSAVELFDGLTMKLVRTQPKYRALLETFVEGEPNTVLVTEYYGTTDAELADKIAKLKIHLDRSGVNYSGLVPLMTPAAQAPVWTVRKAGLGLLMSQRGDFKPVAFIEDTAVPVEHLADHITRLVDFCHSLDTEIAYYAHASGGCLHTRPLLNLKRQDELHKMDQISRFTLKLMHEYGGSFSSEHGDGRSRSWLNEAFFGPDLFALFKEVKRTFDPHNIMNPGNIVDGAPLTENLRFGADYHHIAIEEKLDFSIDLGFHQVVEMCNGAGVCRKHVGTMCPPYMVTLEEEHSTRGRANMLRAALTGKIPAERLTSERMYETMDLCIMCKACKTECPSAVDMAKIKTEFLAHYHDRHGVPLRSRLFGNIHWLSRYLSGPLAWVTNLSMGHPAVRWLNERFLGISAARTMPRFASRSFPRWFAKHRPAVAERQPHSQEKRRVVLFNDTFNSYNEPRIAIAATELLEAAGYEVVLPGHTCCGRPMISKGLLDGARALAAETIERLYPLARAGLPIVGLEPSCISALRDDYFYLLPGDDRVGVVADQVQMFDEFMSTLVARGEVTLRPRPSTTRVLLHGHCHQKALSGTGAAHQLLSAAGFSVQEVDSGCCGMAGSFGYEKEHVDISLAMGERALFPAVRAAADDTLVVAAGTSCRDQIQHGTGKRAWHPAEIVQVGNRIIN